MKINELTPALTKSETEMNLYVKKAEDFSKDVEKYKKIDEKNYDLSKKLKWEITSTKTSIEAARKMFKAPLVELWKTIDNRAKELAKPFQDMQDTMKSRIDIYEKEEKDRKEAEVKRIADIIEKINLLEWLEELSEYHKKLEPNDQKRKAIIETLTLRKNNIKEEIKKTAIEDIKNNIANIDTLEDFKTLVVGEYWDDTDIINTISDRKERITFNIQQKQLKEQQDEIKRKQDEAEKERKEHNDKLFKEQNERLEKIKQEDKKREEEDKKREEEKKKLIEDKINFAKEKISSFQTIEELNNYYNSFIDDTLLEDAILDSYNNRKNQLIEIEEDRKREKEVEENNEKEDYSKPPLSSPNTWAVDKGYLEKNKKEETRELFLDEIPWMLRKIEKDYKIRQYNLDIYFKTNI